jgi:hypothetical protein
MAVVCNCEENIFLAHSISCAIWRWRASRKHFRIHCVRLRFILWTRKILFNLYVFRRFTPISPSLCNNNCKFLYQAFAAF